MKTPSPRLLAATLLWGGWFVALATLAAGTDGAGAAATAEPRSTEYDVKAVFLLNFARFVDWPESAFPSAQAPFVIGLLGESPILEPLRSAVAEETIRRRAITIRVLAEGDDPHGCQIVFVSRADRSLLPALRTRLGRAPVLLVGESENFCQQGGMINLLLDAGSVRFEVNRQVSVDAGLRVSARLLQLARLVGEKG